VPGAYIFSMHFGFQITEDQGFSGLISVLDRDVIALYSWVNIGTPIMICVLEPWTVSLR